MNALTSDNRIPTVQEIGREILFLDAYGMTAGNLAAQHPVDETVWMRRQPLLNPLIDAMAQEGWEYAGAGFFSVVFVKGGLALKLGFKGSDTGSMYAAWCRANQGLPGVPAVYSLSKFARCYVLLTRRYEALRGEWLDDEDADFIPDLCQEYEAIRGAVNNGSQFDIDRFDTVQTASMIHGFFAGVVDFDLHEANIMLDQSGELIITDPISYGACSHYGYYTYSNTERTY